MKLRIVLLVGMLAAAFVHAAIVPTNNTFTGISSTNGWHNFLMPSKADGTLAEIAYMNGAGPRYDYADNDDGVIQDPMPTESNAVVVANGGTITGDGLLADGALLINSVDTNVGNEYVAFTLDGTMDGGETITFEFNAFNQVEYYSYMQGQLWDITASNELAVSSWVQPKAVSDPAYAPIDGFVSYTATAAEDGHQLAIVFREWHNSLLRQGYIDNISVTTTPPHPGIVSFTNNFENSGTISGWYLFTGTATGQYIGTLNGLGSRYDWADNNDSVAQDPMPTESNDWVVAHGGTITGDGNLADGGLLWAVGNADRGDERIAYNLTGTTVTGEVLTLSFNLYNHKDYYNEVTGYFYDLTTGEQLVGDDWISTKAVTDATYTPVDKVVTYTVPGERAEHHMAVVFREWHGSTARVVYLDNLSVVSELPSSPESLYQGWAQSKGLTSSNNAYAQNPDGDELDNLAEYGLDGDPLNPADQGLASVYGMMEEGGTNWMTYVYAQRSDSTERGLDYYLETAGNLVVADWTSINYEVSGTNVTGNAFDYVTNRVSTVDESEQFLRVGIEITP